MGVLEMVVIATIIITAAYVGYHHWEDSQDTVKDIDTHQVPKEIEKYSYMAGQAYQGKERLFSIVVSV